MSTGQPSRHAGGRGVLVSLVAVSIADIASGMSGSFDEGPAQVLGPVLGQRPTDIAVARLAHDRAETGVAGELLGTGEPADVADLGGDRVGEKRTTPGTVSNSGM